MYTWAFLYGAQFNLKFFDWINYFKYAIACHVADVELHQIQSHEFTLLSLQWIKYASYAEVALIWSISTCAMPNNEQAKKQY